MDAGVEGRNGLMGTEKTRSKSDETVCKKKKRCKDKGRSIDGMMVTWLGRDLNEPKQRILILKVRIPIFFVDLFDRK